MGLSFFVLGLPCGVRPQWIEQGGLSVSWDEWLEEFDLTGRIGLLYARWLTWFVMESGEEVRESGLMESMRMHTHSLRQP
jgi:hypothetical protein